MEFPPEFLLKMQIVCSCLNMQWNFKNKKGVFVEQKLIMQWQLRLVLFSNLT